MKTIILLMIGLCGLGPVILHAGPEVAEFAILKRSYEAEIHPLLERYCLDCHDEATSEGELDLERFGDLAAVRADSKTWQDIVYQLETGEMPPRNSKKNIVPQPSADERAALIDWARKYLDTEARSQAGDPGPVILRRLSNSEYTYTVRDLTGVPTLDPVREFPVDSAAGEGFTNAGGALVMSPALLEKYLAAGKEIASHAVLLPDGFRFSEKTTRADHANEILAELRSTYLKTTGGDHINFAYNSQVRRAAPEGVGEGRVDLKPYFATLLAHHDALRKDGGQARKIAESSGLNARYFETLTRALINSPADGSFLLDHFRERLATAGPDEAAQLAAELRAWQDKVWAFDTVGQFGLIRSWQRPVTPVVENREIRERLAPEDNPAKPGTNTLFFNANSFGEGNAVVEWQQPRIQRPGRPPLLLADLDAGLEAILELRKKTLASTTAYLQAASDLRTQGEPADVTALAERNDLHPEILRAWASYLGLAHGGRVEVAHLTARIPNAGSYDFIKGWTMPGVPDYSLLANSSDRAVRIPGDMQPRKLVVHPRPDRWIAAGWMSPITGRVKLSAHVRDAHNACGNGVEWSVDLRRGDLTRVLRSANLELGKVAQIEPVTDLEVRKGDLVSIIIGARDNNHSCDLTEIDLSVEELEGEKRSWSLAGDCAPDIHAGNPHPDRHGNLTTWHFHGGMNDQRRTDSGVAPGSTLELWLNETVRGRRDELADRIQTLLTKPLPEGTSEADNHTFTRLTSLDGPLFAQLDVSALARSRRKAGSPAPFDSEGNLRLSAPAQFTIEVPSDLVVGADLVTRGSIHSSSATGAVMQLHAGATPKLKPRTLDPGEPLVVAPGGPARAAMENAVSDFRNLFPAAMCYARVVPADEVVTLLLYHREDEHLKRLMLDPDERDRLDQLWDQLLHISREPQRLVTAYEQLWQFATQDSDPTKFEPMEAAIRKRAATFERKLSAAEPTHLAALLEFAPMVYRRPLSKPEEARLITLYQRLRDEELSHEEAFRLTLARLFSSAAFLYKSETPARKPPRGPVTNWELATRLSYFLTSSAPDTELTRAAQEGSLTNEKTLLEQTHRLLKDEKTRRLAIEFACQWLHIRNFDQHDEKNEKLYPEFSELRGRMYEESVRFFTDFFQNDRSVLSLLNADHTFADPELAGFYNLPAPKDGWQRINDTRKSGRGGILGFASTLAKQSGASRTSPILRGNWVSESLLGEKLPKPPKGVPTLPDEVPEGLSERELILKHSADPACAKCHAKIDQYGFTLEAYDAIGRFRPGQNTNAKLPDGKSIHGFDGLRDYLLVDRRETFVRHFCQKLLGYAIGREVQLSDEPFLDDLMKKLEQQDYQISVAVDAIVLSPQFREIRAGR